MIFVNRNRLARACRSSGVANIDRSILFLLRLLEEPPPPPPPPPLNHLDTRIVLENSFRDVFSFIGPVSPPSLSEKSAFRHLLSWNDFVFLSDLTLDDDETDVSVGSVGEIDIEAFVTVVAGAVKDRESTARRTMEAAAATMVDGVFILCYCSLARSPVACVCRVDEGVSRVCPWSASHRSTRLRVLGSHCLSTFVWFSALTCLLLLLLSTDCHMLSYEPLGKSARLSTLLYVQPRCPSTLYPTKRSAFRARIGPTATPQPTIPGGPAVIEDDSPTVSPPRISSSLPAPAHLPVMPLVTFHPLFRPSRILALAHQPRHSWQRTLL